MSHSRFSGCSWDKSLRTTRRQRNEGKTHRTFRPLTSRCFRLLSLEPLEHRILLDAGVLDPSFGEGGQVLTGFNGKAAAAELLVQPDGKIVAVGSALGTDFAMARYNPDGSLDEFFGTDGKVTTEVNADGHGTAQAAVVQADGKIVVAGITSFGLSGEMRGDFALARYDADGSLDDSFGVGGLVTTGFGNDQQDYAWSVALQADGKIVAAGHSFGAGIKTGTALARFNANGTLDISFGTEGRVFDQSGSPLFEHAMVLQADGKIVMGGFDFPAGDFLLKRFNGDGSPDTLFGSGGIVTTDFGGTDNIWSLAAQPDGKLVAVGETEEDVTTGHGPSDLAVARYNTDGSLDTSFGTGGRFTTTFRTFTSNPSVVLQPDGKIVSMGSSTAVFDPGPGEVRQWTVALARYDADGSPDLTFGVAGQVFTEFGTGANDLANGLALQSDGKIVIGGNVGDSFLVARYLGDSPHEEFDFGDAPIASQSIFAASYPTTLADNGARHLLVGPTLGANRDHEADGQPNLIATADDTNGVDDEDGVLLPETIVPGLGTTATVEVSAAGKLDAWLDFNRDGDWSDSGEQIATSLALVAGTNSIDFAVPATAAVGTTFARFRLSTAGGLAPTGESSDGEVEDSAVLIVAPEPENHTPTTTSIPPRTYSDDTTLAALELRDYFHDAEDGPAGLSYTVTANSNPELFDAITLDAQNDRLVLTFNPGTLGEANLLIRATDSDGLFVETNFAVTVSHVTVEPQQQLQFGQARYSTSEHSINVVIEIVRTGGSDGSIGVTVSTGSGTATADADYTDITQAITLGPGQLNSYASIRITNDEVGEDDESVSLALSGFTGGAVPGGLSSALLTIVDDDDRSLARFDWTVPPHFGSDDFALSYDPQTGETTLNPGSDGLIDYRYDAAYVRPASWRVNLDASSSYGGGSSITQFQWEIAGAVSVTDQSLFPFDFPAEGTFPVSLTITTADGQSNSITQDVVVKDYLIVSIGDSVASGEGNPDKAAVWGPVPPFGFSGVIEQPKWQDRRCHRSAEAGPAQAALDIERADPRTSVTFLSVACSGAKITTGLLEPFEGIEPPKNFSHEPLPPQLQQVKDLVGGRQIDSLLMSIGANDVEFAAIVREAASPFPFSPNIQDNSTLVRELDHNVMSLPGLYTRLAEAIETEFPLSPVYLTEYHDFTHDHLGNHVTFPGALSNLNASEAEWLSNTVGLRVGNVLIAAAKEHHWSYVGDIARQFLRHGYPAGFGFDSALHWVVRYEESVQAQDNDVGTTHPNRRGQQVYANRIVEAILDRTPVANAGVDQTVDEGATASFNGGASSDPEGDRLTYRWDPEPNLNQGATSTFIYPDDEGSPFTLTLTVTDQFGKESSDEVRVTVRNVAPTATLTNSGLVNDHVVVTFSNQVDRSPVDEFHGFTYSYDYNNDGTFESNDILSASANIPAGSLSAGSGSQTVRGRIKDKDGGFTDYTTLILGPPWQNPLRPFDTNGDGQVVPLDVLRIVNELNNPTILEVGGKLPASRPSDSTLPYYDVNGDSFCTPNDVLRIVNFLNGNSAEGERYGPQPASQIEESLGAIPFLVPSFSDDDDELLNSLAADREEVCLSGMRRFD